MDFSRLTDTELAERIIEADAAEKAATAIAKTAKDEAKRRWTVGEDTGTRIMLTRVERLTYRVREVLALQREYKLNPSDVLTVKNAGIKALPEDLKDRLPFTAKASIKLTIK